MRVIYQAYGTRDFLDQALFSALSLRHHDAAGVCRIAIYTDRPALFAPHGFDVVALDAATIAGWRGRFDYIHRMKLEVLRHAIGRFPAETGWMALDADTQWRRAPADLDAMLRAGQALMHVYEGPIGPAFHGPIHRVWRRHFAHLPPVEMRNAGVVGIPAPAADADAAVGEMIELTDRLLLLCLKRGWVEQAAVSSVMQRRYRVEYVGERLLHYWNMNREIGPALARFFAAHAGLDTPALARAVTEFDPQPETRALQARLNAAPRTWRHYWTKARRSWAKRKIDLRVIAARLRLL